MQCDCRDSVWCVGVPSGDSSTIGRLGWHVYWKWETCDDKRVTIRSLTESDRGTIEPTILMWEILDNVLFRWWVPRRINSIRFSWVYGKTVKREPLSASTDSSVWRPAVADDWEMEMKSWVLSAYWCWLECVLSRWTSWWLQVLMCC